MADISQLITLGIGDPAGIPEFLTLGLQIGSVVPVSGTRTVSVTLSTRVSDSQTMKTGVSASPTLSARVAASQSVESDIEKSATLSTKVEESQNITEGDE